MYRAEDKDLNLGKQSKKRQIVPQGESQMLKSQSNAGLDTSKSDIGGSPLKKVSSSRKLHDNAAPMVKGASKRGLEDSPPPLLKKQSSKRGMKSGPPIVKAASSSKI